MKTAVHLIRALDGSNLLGIRFVSADDDVDTDSPMGKAMSRLIGAVTELESSLISEQVQSGSQKGGGSPSVARRRPATRSKKSGAW